MNTSKALALCMTIVSYFGLQVPPEPPEQAGRSLYERLEISGMRAQLLRRSSDLKKNINGSHKYLDVLREMSAVVSLR